MLLYSTVDSGLSITCAAAAGLGLDVDRTARFSLRASFDRLLFLLSQSDSMRPLYS